jgi:lipoyl(octanoyl) transferase
MDLQGLRVRELGQQPYIDIWQAMSHFTNERNDATLDELWIVEHDPVFTQGQAGKPEHILHNSDIPIVKSDRGGQVTYHGPGQLVLYPLINLRRRHLGVRDMVTLLEELVVEWLATYQIDAYAKADAPGVYITVAGEDAKIASLGLRIRRGCSFHGVAINIDMDLTPFQYINPCGYQGMAMTQLRHHLVDGMPSRQQVMERLVTLFAKKIQATTMRHTTELLAINKTNNTI